MNVSGLVSNAQRLAVRNSPAILISIGVASLVTTVVLAVKATPKANQIIMEVGEERYSVNMDRDLEENTKFDDAKYKVKEIWHYTKAIAPIYGPAMLTGVASIGCFIGANRIHVKRQEMLVAAYAFSEKALRTYQNKVIETIGNKKHMEVVDSIAEDRVRANPLDQSLATITSHGETLCYDAYSGRYFFSDINDIYKAENEIMRRLTEGECCDLNDFYYELGLPAVKSGSIVGWDPNDILIEVRKSPILNDKGEPCLAIDYLVGVLESRYQVL